MSTGSNPRLMNSSVAPAAEANAASTTESEVTQVISGHDCEPVLEEEARNDLIPPSFLAKS